MADSQPRHFLLDIGFEPGFEFCTALLETAEFPADLLRSFGGAGPKAEASAAVASGVISGQVDADRLVLEFCRRPRTWLYLGQSKDGLIAPAAARGAQDFLTQFGENGWYGPFADPDVEGRTWWVWTQAVRHSISVSEFGEDKRVITRKIRWNVIAQVDKGIVALHWNNFNHRDSPEDPDGHQQQFAYWKHLPKIVQKLTPSGDALVPPPFHKLVLTTLMEQYEPDPGYSWQHLRVRAESEGVAMNARAGSGQVSDVDLSGIRNLTGAIAQSVGRDLGLNEPQRKLAERAILRTFVREWGTLSYEFSLEFEDPPGGFRGHVYFGLRTELWGIDSLPHCRCFHQYGGSIMARDFFVDHWQ